MTSFPSLLARVSDALQRAGVSHMIIGGQAVLVHGEPRFTQDIDVTVGLQPDGAGSIVRICDELQLSIDVEDPLQFVVRTHVLPAGDAETGMRIDFVFSSTLYEAQAIERAKVESIHNVEVPFASMEDLILHKLLARRPTDIQDIKGILRVNGEAIDWKYIDHWAQAFGEVPGHEDVLPLLEAIRSAER